MNEELKKLTDWLYEEIEKLEQEIEDGQMYEWRSNKIDAFNEVLYKINEIGYEVSSL